MSDNMFKCLFIFLVSLLISLSVQAQNVFEAQLLGSNQAPPVSSQAGGTCKAVLSEDNSQFGIGCTYVGLTPEAPPGVMGSVHIHNGAPGTNGNIILDLSPALTTGSFGAGDGGRRFDGSIQATVPITAEQVQQLRAGNLYVNIHTAAHPSGEIRGQLVAAPVFEPVTFRALLSGEFQVPPLFTQASGQCEGILNATRTEFSLNCEHTLGTAEPGGHIHMGATGVNGSIVFNLPNLGASPIRIIWSVTPPLVEGRPAINRPLTPEMVDELLGNRLYVNLHSPGRPSGELRSQIFQSNLNIEVIPTLSSMSMLLVGLCCVGLGGLMLGRQRRT